MSEDFRCEDCLRAYIVGLLSLNGEKNCEGCLAQFKFPSPDKFKCPECGRKKASYFRFSKEIMIWRLNLIHNAHFYARQTKEKREEELEAA